MASVENPWSHVLGLFMEKDMAADITVSGFPEPVSVIVTEHVWVWHLRRLLREGWVLREEHWLRPTVSRELLLPGRNAR